MAEQAAVNPFEVPTPAGAEGWQEMYPYYLHFSEERREFDERKFWFCNTMHFPEPVSPMDIFSAEAAYISLGQFQSKVLNIPTVLGIDHRVLNGYVYISTNATSDPAIIGPRVEEFLRRAGHYFSNWEKLEKHWQAKTDAVIAELEGISIPVLGELEDFSMVEQATGIGSAYKIIREFDKAVECYYQLWQLHFEMLLLGYGAYMEFFGYCKTQFPDITDEIIAGMVAGFDVTMFQPDEQLKALAKLAVELNVDAVFVEGRDPQDIVTELSNSAAGQRWLAELEERKHPWFQISTGDGFYHHHRTWNDDPRLPFSALAGYVVRVRNGEDLKRPTEHLQEERDRIAEEYAELLDEEARAEFYGKMGLSRMVFPHVESHKFYVEHWGSSLFWNTIRDFGRTFVEHGFIDHEDDIFFFNVHEIRMALSDLTLAWSGGSPARGPGYWGPKVAQRRSIINVLREWTPPPALGPIPENIEDPMLLMLWGVTPDQLRKWAQPPGEGGAGTELEGYPASSGIVEGPARVVRSVEEISLVQPGEILVCPVTAPSWGPVFPKIAAAVSDIGGMMSHAAIVAREYGMPAVVGTGHATKVIKTGDTVRVDGNTGKVTVLS
mgnify:CR=1 FL=1